jgi:hypothetical protein
VKEREAFDLTLQFGDLFFWTHHVSKTTLQKCAHRPFKPLRQAFQPFCQAAAPGKGTEGVPLKHLTLLCAGKYDESGLIGKERIIPPYARLR